MKILRKTTVTILAVLLLVAAFAGCKPSATSEETEPKDSETQATQEQKTEDWTYTMGGIISVEPVTLSLIVSENPAVTVPEPSSDVPIWAAIEKRLGVTFDWEVLARDTYNELLNTRLMSSDLPDIVRSISRSLMPDFIEEDFVWSYDDLGFEENAPYATEIFKQEEYSQLEKNYRSVYSNGEIYCFGNTMIENNNLSLMFNTKWLEIVGKQEPTSVEEFLDVLRAFRDQDVNGNGDPNDEVPIVQTVLYYDLGQVFSLNLFNPWMLDENGNVFYSWADEKCVDYLKLRKQLVDENLIAKDATGTAQNLELAAANRLGALTYYPNWMDDFSATSPLSGENKDEEVFACIAPLANIYTGEHYRYLRRSAPQTQEYGLFILTAAENPEVCLRAIDWLWASKEGEEMFQYGIEGLSYEYNENGEVVLIQPDDYEGTSFIESIGGLQPPFAYRQVKKYWYDAYLPWQKARDDSNEQYYIEGLYPPVFSAEELEAVNTLYTDIKTYTDETIAKFIDGSKPIEEFDEYVAQLKVMGLEELIALYQAKFDSME